MVDLALLRIPTFSAAMLISFASRAATFGLLALLILWLGGPLQMSALTTGLVLLVLSVVMVVAAGASSSLAQKLSVKTIISLGMVLGGLGLALSALLIDGGSSWLALLPALVLLGLGSGLVMPHLMGLAVGVVPPARAGMASGASNTFLPLGTAVGVAVYGVVMSAVVSAHLPDAGLAREVSAGRMPHGADWTAPARDAFASGLSVALLIASALSVIAGVLALWLVRERDLRQDAEAAA